MKKALKNYARGDGEAPPVREEAVLFSLLNDAVKGGVTWCAAKGVDLGVIAQQDELEEDFSAAPHRNLEIIDLRAFLESKFAAMLGRNGTRADFVRRYQSIIDQYNLGAAATENYFDDLMNFNRDLYEEDERHIREGLSEDELELFDLLKREELTGAETRKFKLAAKTLLKRLVEEQPKVLVQDWFKDSQSQQRVRMAVEEVRGGRASPCRNSVCSSLPTKRGVCSSAAPRKQAGSALTERGFSCASS